MPAERSIYMETAAGYIAKQRDDEGGKNNASYLY